MSFYQTVRSLVFGIKTLIKGIVTWGSDFTISAIMENPFNQNSAIIMAQSSEGTRPFLVIFKDTIIDRNQFAFVPSERIESVLTVEAYNNYKSKPLDLDSVNLTARQLDGSAPTISTEPLILFDIFRRLSTEVTGYQTDRVNGIDALNGDVDFNALFDSGTGLEILGGISETDGTKIVPITEP
jgi:hypothetical protein